MSAAVAEEIDTFDDERRRFRRVKVHLLGRFMLQNRQEYPCQVVNMSPGGMAVIAPMIGEPRERVIAYVDHIGRVEGQIMRLFPRGFAMTIEATVRKREKIAAQLTWLANRQTLGMPEDRRHERNAPKNPHSSITLPSGAQVPCRVLDVSLSGAAVTADIRPAIGTPVSVGKTAGRVVRLFEGGFAIEFVRLLQPEAFDDNLTEL